MKYPALAVCFLCFLSQSAVAEHPEYIVVRVPVGGGAIDVVPLQGEMPALDEDSAPEIAARAEEECDELKDEAERAYRRIARAPQRWDIQRVRDAACSFDTSCSGSLWRYNRELGGFNVAASAECAQSSGGRSLYAYFPSLPRSGTYRNLNVPIFGSWYMGAYSPFSWFNYVWMSRGFYYYYYFAPWL
jgi:hypothetical protein